MLPLLQNGFVTQLDAVESPPRAALLGWWLDWLPGSVDALRCLLRSKLCGV